jgi:ribose transport system substrate-binding protein
MSKLKLLVSLPTSDNDFQVSQAFCAQQAARRLGIDLQVTYAHNIVVNQITQILNWVEAPVESRPQGIVFEPVGGSTYPGVARVASQAGIGWAVLNRAPDYISQLRKTATAPIFAVSSDHVEIGRIQGRQFAALLPRGGSILYLEGPWKSSSANQRTLGMLETKPSNIQVIRLKGQWTAESAMRAVRSWLARNTAHRPLIDLIGAQDDSMAIGARKAFEEITDKVDRERFLSLPFTGCDGQPETGQTWEQEG